MTPRDVQITNRVLKMRGMLGVVVALGGCVPTYETPPVYTGADFSWVKYDQTQNRDVLRCEKLSERVVECSTF